MTDMEVEMENKKLENTERSQCVSFVPTSSIFNTYSIQIGKGKAWEMWSHTMMSERQMIEQGAIPVPDAVNNKQCISVAKNFCRVDGGCPGCLSSMFLQR